MSRAAAPTNGLLIVAIVIWALFAGASAVPGIIQSYGIEAAWLAGITTIGNNLGSFGTLNVTSPTNYPGTRSGSCSWLHIHPETGNVTLYLYGGLYGATLTQAGWQDMWRFDPVISRWTWIGGPSTTSTSSTSVGTPGLRYRPQCWVVRNRLYLQGGRSASVYPDDIWYFDVTTTSWTLLNNTGAISCATNAIGPRTGAMVWNVPRNGSLDYYGQSDVFIFGGYTSSTTGFSNIWQWIEDVPESPVGFVCLQNYPTSTTTITTPDRDWSSPSPTATYPGQLDSPGTLTSPGYGGWVYGEMLVLAVDASAPAGWVYMGYYPSLNRWSVISRPSQGSTYALYPPYANITETAHPVRTYYHWADYNPPYGDEPVVFCLTDAQDVRVPNYNIWSYQYESDTWTWFTGGQYTELQQGPIYGSQGVYAPAYTAGPRLHPIFQSTYLPYALPDGNPPPTVFIGFGEFRGSSSGRIADIWAYRASESLAPVPSWNAPTTIEYSFLGGQQGYDIAGEYGTVGVSTPSTCPPGRQYALTWTYTPTDGSPSTLYIYGGLVYHTNQASPPLAFYYADMWKFETATAQWTWLGGPNGTVPLGDQPVDWPGARYNGLAWRAGEKLYLSGGRSSATTITWAYDINASTWSPLADSTLIQCGPSTSFRSRVGAALWAIPSTTSFGAAADFYAYGGESPVGNPGGNNNIWKWNTTGEVWDCIQDYYSTPTQADAAGFRNFTTVLDATATRPGPYDLGGAWVYNATLLVLQPTTGTSLWGYSIPLNRWAVISTPTPTTLIPSNSATLDTLALPGATTVSAAWTDYFLYASGEPALMLYGSGNGAPSTSITTSLTSSAPSFGNTWSYSYVSDSWSYYAGGNGYWRTASSSVSYTHLTLPTTSRV